MDRLVPISVKCTSCRQSLMDKEVLLNDRESVKIGISYKGNKGNLWLCSYYGCDKKQMDIEIPDSEIAEITCPHCNADLNTNVLCEVCDAPMVTFGITTGGRVSVCSRKGCAQHYVSFQNLDDAIRRFHEEFDSY